MRKIFYTLNLGCPMSRGTVVGTAVVIKSFHENADVKVSYSVWFYVA